MDITIQLIKLSSLKPLAPLLDVPYGDSDGEKLDIYLPEAVSEGNWGLVVALRSQLGALPWPTRPLFCPTAIPFLVFFHGGYWQSGR